MLKRSPSRPNDAHIAPAAFARKQMSLPSSQKQKAGGAEKKPKRPQPFKGQAILDGTPRCEQQSVQRCERLQTSVYCARETPSQTAKSIVNTASTNHTCQAPSRKIGPSRSLDRHLKNIMPKERWVKLMELTWTPPNLSVQFRGLTKDLLDPKRVRRERSE